MASLANARSPLRVLFMAAPAASCHRVTPDSSSSRTLPTRHMSRRLSRVLAALAGGTAAVASVVSPALVIGQQRPSAAATQAPAVVTRTFGDLGQGPYKSLVIRNAMVIPGHGGPPAGPYDIMIEGGMITQMVPFDPVAAERRGPARA
ncbi:MAG: hypothetical protein ACLGIK_04355 [Gemmatimonadota bacterium]